MVLDLHAGPEMSVRVYFVWQYLPPRVSSFRMVGPFYAWKQPNLMAALHRGGLL